MSSRGRVAGSAIGVLALVSTVSVAEVQGEPEAIVSAHQVVESLGGREAWRDLRYLHATIKGYRAEVPHEVIEELWTDLRWPYTYFSMKGEGFDYSRAVTPEGGWTLRNGDFTLLTGEPLQNFLDFWRGSEHVLYYRLAVGDPTLRVLKAGPRRLEFYEVGDGAALGWFDLNASHEPVGWLAPFGDSSIRYVFGPLQEFGDLRLPKWGALVDGSWRFENLEIATGEAAPPISFAPPEPSAR